MRLPGSSLPGALALAAALFLPAPPGRAADVTYDANGFFHLNSGQGDYVGYRPDTYDAGKPISLFVWMHGCGGEAEGDMWAIAPSATRARQSYIAISLGGRDGACWKPNADGPKVLAAIADLSRHFHVDPRKIYVGGYSSGGDLAYRVAFEHADSFAGILAENTDPFRDTGATPASLLAGASWKINVAHLAHLSDATYPIAGVRANLATLVDHGFPVTKIEKPGSHYDADAGPSGTTYDLIHSLLPYLDVGWVGPGPAAPPAITLTTPAKVITSKAAYVVKGSVPAGASVDYVEVRVGQAKFRKAKNTVNWTFRAPLVVGKNPVTARAVAPDGTRSRSVKTILVRRPARR